MNVATGGFGTEITAQTDEGLKNSLGGAAYILTGKRLFWGVLLTSFFEAAHRGGSGEKNIQVARFF